MENSSERNYYKMRGMGPLLSMYGGASDEIEQMYKFRGWVRISFHWLMTKKMIINIFEALEYIIKNGHKYLKYYNYDTKQNLYKSIKIE